MAISAVLEEMGEERRREFRRVLAVSVAIHVGGIFLFGWTPTWQTAPQRPEVIAVDLVAAPSPEPTGARPAPAPAPPPPVKKTVVLPKEPTLPKPVPEAKPKPEPKPQRRELDPSDLQRPAAERDYDDVLAQLRNEAGESDAPVEEPKAAPAPAPAAASAGTGRPVSPEVAAWIRRTKIHVRRNWVVPPGFRTQPLRTRLVVRLDASGAVQGEPQVVEGSGNPWYDEGVVRAIQKASPLPAPPEAGEWPFTFVPEDSY